MCGHCFTPMLLISPCGRYGSALLRRSARYRPYWSSRDPAAFRKLLLEQRVTVLNQTPSAFRQLLQADLVETRGTYALRYIIFGGEALELPVCAPGWSATAISAPNSSTCTGSPKQLCMSPIARSF